MRTSSLLLPAPIVEAPQTLDGKQIMAYLSRGALLGIKSQSSQAAYLYSSGQDHLGHHREWTHPIQSSVFNALLQLELITTYTCSGTPFAQCFHASFRLPRLPHIDHEPSRTPPLPSLPSLNDVDSDHFRLEPQDRVASY